MLGAAVAATAAVTFGSAGTASAFTIYNSTGYTLSTSVENQGDNETLANNSSYSWPDLFITSLPTTVNYTFTTGPLSHYVGNTLIVESGCTWTVSDSYSGIYSGKPQVTVTQTIYGSVASGDPQASFQLGDSIVDLTIGGITQSFENTPFQTQAYDVTVGSSSIAGASDPQVGLTVGGSSLAAASAPQVGHIGATPNYKRGAIITKNDLPMKIWNARTNPLRGLAAKPTAPVSVGEEVSPVSSTLPAQPQSVAKTATPHRAAARR